MSTDTETAPVEVGREITLGEMKVTIKGPFPIRAVREMRLPMHEMVNAILACESDGDRVDAYLTGLSSDDFERLILRPVFAALKSSGLESDYEAFLDQAIPEHQLIDAWLAVAKEGRYLAERAR